MLSCREIKFEDNLDWDKLIKESMSATFFQTKEWLTLWLKHFPKEVRIMGVFDGEELVGIAPFSLDGHKINFLGTTPVLEGELVSDYGDIVAKISCEKTIWQEILAKVKSIVLNFIREDSPSFEVLQELGGRAEEIDVAPYIELPKTWESYLAGLDRHDRHELRRKMRKLEEGVVIKGDLSNVDEFFRLMAVGNEQKRNFLKEEMKTFFQDIILMFLPKNKLELRFLEYEGKKIAATLYFVFQGEVLLYNSGFDPKYSYLSPGLVLKAFAIKESIEKGLRRFDFLRGRERYKYDLGGKERKLYKIKLT